LEKILTVICVLGAFLSIGLLVGLIVVAVNEENSKNGDEYCLTKSCIEESLMVLNNMNLEAEP
jgi:hypothetical protein